MGGNHTYLEAGKHHGDTVAYKDEDMLASIGKHPTRITAVRVWWDKFVVGMEVFYDGTSAGARLGSEHTPGLVYQDLILAEGEYLTRVHGRAGDIMDYVVFETNTGRQQAFGASGGGDPFDLHVEGKYIKGFTCGFGGHLHFIGCHFGDLYFPPVRSETFGKTHGDTQVFDDFTGILGSTPGARMTEIRVIHDNNLVYGFEALYEGNGLASGTSGGIHVGGEMNPSCIN